MPPWSPRGKLHAWGGVSVHTILKYTSTPLWVGDDGYVTKVT